MPRSQATSKESGTNGLTGKTALVTGSTSGIGLEIARVLAGMGANVVLNGFGDTKQIERDRSERERLHGVVIAHDAADLLVAGQIEAMCAAALRRFGGVDEVASLVAYLENSDGADSISGAILPIHGGRTAH